VESDILTFVVVDVDRNFFDKAELPAVGGFESLEIGGEDVVVFLRWQLYFEFSTVVGNGLPANLAGLIFPAADFDRNSLDWVIVRAPDRADDDGVGLTLGFLG